MKQYTKYRIYSGLLSIFVGVITCWPMPVSAAPDLVKLYVAPASQSIVSGNSFTLQVRLIKDTNAKVDYAKADIVFPSQYFEIISISRSGSHFSYNGGPLTSFNNSNGTLVVSGSGDTLPTNANVLVASVTFRAKAVGTRSVSFTDSSVAGDELGSGNVKNALTATAEASINITPPPSPPVTTQRASNNTTPDQTPSPATPESESEIKQIPTLDEQNESSSYIEQTEIVADTATTPEQRIQLWQWILSGLLSVGAICGIAYVLITKKREEPVMLPETITKTIPTDTHIEAAGNENSSTNLYGLGSTTNEVSQDIPQSSLRSGPGVVPALATEASEQPAVGGVEIQPLDPAWSARLNLSPDVTQDISTEPVSPVLPPQVQITEQTYPTPLPSEPPLQVMPRTVEAPVPAQPPRIAPTQPDEFPDMFEEGAARLSAEGFDEQLKPKNVT